MVCVNLFGHLSSSGYGGVIANTDCPAELIEQAALDYTNEIIKMHQFLNTKDSMLCVEEASLFGREGIERDYSEIYHYCPEHGD